ncbi:SPOR domain-containing protein [Gemmobacter nectariphilus]|uniref:SPOR domain-containing protein n=1 Tax=Gemmobacter nectariphilus TaxID=220343 RepID=UPI000483E673|nr:SPOR domain-containing protein [Gemmobacter nectariphilus]
MTNGRKTLIRVLAAGAVLTLAGCDGGMPLFAKKPAEDVAAEAAVPAGTTRLVERDVEAPDVFNVSESGLWDGRPSLGGVWVAYPTVKDPERVIIRNPANGKFVIGALFRREREMPGPKLQVSSDAAAALGLLAGQPGKLDVTALRREEVAEEPALPPAKPVLDAPETIATETLDALKTAPSAPAVKPAEPAQGAQPAAKPETAKPAAAKPAAGGRTLIQIGIFSVEANAKGAAAQLTKAGAQTQIKKEESQGKTFWRVLAGPAADVAGRDALMAKVKGAGFKDAYFVSR